MVPISDFSGLTSWACALASAAAMVPIDSLERCTAILHIDDIEADGTRFGAFGAHAVADDLLGILRHQRFKLCFGALVIQESRMGAAEEASELCPGIRAAHVHDANGFDPGLGGLDTEEARELAALDTAPELPLSCDNEVLIERIGMSSDLNPFAAAGNYRKYSAPGRNHPHIVLQLRHVFLDRCFFRERPRQHELGLEHPSVGFNSAVERGCHPRSTGCR